MKGVLVAAALIFALMLVIKDGRASRNLGLTGSCHAVATPKGQDGLWEACVPGRLEGAADPVPRVAHPVVNPPSLHRPEERQVVGGDVDRPSPRAIDSSVGEARQQTPQAMLRPRRSCAVRREALVDAAAESDRTGAAAH